MRAPNKPLKIMTIVGARPQFIKAAALSKTIATSPDFSEFILHTGQHYDQAMSDIFFNELEIPRPNLILDIKEQHHGAMTGKQLIEIEAACLQHQPDLMVVYGDVNSTLAGALAAAKLHIPIAHIEAGLRSYQRRMPEEINRVVADHLAHWLFVPTQAAKENLRREGINDEQIHVVGDIMLDAFMQFRPAIEAMPSPIFANPALTDQDYIVTTIHRAENTDDMNKLAVLIDSLQELAKDYPIVFPCHPRTQKQIQAFGLKLGHNIHLIEPVGYCQMQKLVMQSRCVLTDSGGLQKEAFFNRKPCVVLRPETEWVELLETGWTQLPATLTVEDIVNTAKSVISATPDTTAAPYGDGTTSAQILAIFRSDYASQFTR